VTGQRRLRIVERLADHEAARPDTRHLCEVCADVTCVTGAGIMLMSDDLPRGSVCSTDHVSDLLERLQFTLGEGPCVDAFRQDHPVLVPDLGHPSALRWPGFTGPATDAGVRAIFGFPLRIGAVRLGALTLYSDRAVSLTTEQHADALVMADVAAQAVLVSQADAAPGRLAEVLEAGSDFHYGVHQAAGMVAVQLQISVGQALVRLRAFAFANDRSVTEVAHDVVTRRLRFDAGRGEEDVTA
jgi:hypothetical protein